MTDPLDRAAESLRAVPVPPGPPPDVEAATLAALAAVRPRRRRIGRALAGAAALAAAVALAVALGTGSSASALEAAVAKARAAKSVKFVSTLVVKHPAFEPQVSTVYWQGSRMRVEKDGQVHIADLAAGEALFLQPDGKYAFRMTSAQKFDPPLEHFNKLVGARGAKDGADDIGGVRADRFRITAGRKDDPRDYRLWVDPRTGWPVKLECRDKADMTAFDPKAPPAEAVVTGDRYEWDVRLDEKLFSLEVPPGYELGPGPRMHRPGKE